MFKIIKKQITKYYLLEQYFNAKKYLEINIQRNTGEDIDLMCEHVRYAGIAYASAEFNEYSKKGSFTEECFCRNNGITGEPESYSRFQEFLRETDEYIASIMKKKLEK